MDNIGAEVGQKMRSAIKAKLMELDCYVDDELPDYIMVMVANKRTKSQMNEDLNLFLSTKTSTFVNWLHIVLKKLKEVTVTNPDIYKKVSKRKSDEHSEVKTKKEKKDKKVKKEEPQDVPDEKPIIKPEEEPSASKVSNEHQEEKSLTDDLPITTKSLAENRKVVISSSTEISDTHAAYEDNFDIPLMSDIQDCNEEDLDALEKKIKSVKSRLGLIVESDDETQENQTNVEDHLEKEKSSEQNYITEDKSEQSEETEAGTDEKEASSLVDSRQISILEGEISESHNKELERLTTALEQEENEEESYTPKRKEPNDDEDTLTTKTPEKEDETRDKPKYPERRHERITFNPDELSPSPKRSNVRDRLGRKSSTSPERPERDRRRNSFYAGCEEERFKRNDPKVHRDFKEWVALRQRDNSRDKRDRSRERIRNTNRSWDRRGRSRERHDGSWDRRDRSWDKRDKSWDKRDKSRDNNWDKRDKSWDRYERTREGRNRSRSVERRNRSRSGEGRSRNKEPPSRDKGETVRDRRDISSDGKEKTEEKVSEKPKEIKSEGILSRVVLSKVSVPQKEDKSDDDEQVVREVPSLVKVKRTMRTGRAQPNKNLLLRAMAEAQKSVAQAPKSGITSPKKPKSIHERLGGQQKSRRLLEVEKDRLKHLLEQTRKNRILQRRLDLEECESSDGEYIPKPVRKGYESSKAEYIPKPVTNEVPKYVPSTKTSQENSDESDKSDSPKRKFIITLDGIDSVENDLKSPSTEEEKPKNREKSPPKTKTDVRKNHSPIVFSKKEISGQSTVKVLKPNIPDKLPVVHPPLSVKIKERCKYWPGCRQGDKCEFVHPSQTCETFPQCKFGDKCLYLHPKCKFGSSCTKKDCPYDHNVVNPAVASKILAPSVQNCKFYPNCTNLSCPFFHPKPCKYGKYCANISECVFYHNPTAPVRRSLSWKSK